MKKIYWMKSRVPEVEGLSKAEMKLAWAYAYPKVFRHWQGWVGVVLAVGVFAGVFVWLSGLFGGISGSAIAGGVAGGLGALVLEPVVATVGRRYMGEWRAGR